MTLSRLVSGLEGRGWQVAVVRPKQASDFQGDVQRKELLVLGLPIPGYAGLRFGLPVFFRLLKEWRQNRPDIVHIATEGPLGWAALKAAHRMNIPVTSSFHTNFHRYCGHYGVGWLRGLVNKHLRDFHNQCAYTLVPSTDVQQTLQLDDYHNVMLLGRGIDTQLFNPQRRSAALRASWGVDENALVVIYVGRIAPEKNLDLVLSSFEAIQKNAPHARMVWVGSGPAASKLSRSHPDHIFCGSKIGVDLAEHYASADMFLFPSLTETFGNVVPEGMASGLAVVAYDYAAAAQHIQHHENGVLVACGNVENFIHESVSLAKDILKIRTLGKQASCSLSQHSWSNVCGEFETTLRKAISGHQLPVTARLINKKV